jgi:hypothetical protein
VALFTSNFKKIIFYVCLVIFANITLFYVILFSNASILDDPFSENNRINYVLGCTGKQCALPPELVIMGSSRASFSLESKKIAETLGYDPTRSVNVGFPGFCLSTFHKLLDKMNFDSIKEIIICPDEYFFYNLNEESIDIYKQSILDDKKHHDPYKYFLNPKEGINPFIKKTSWLKRWVKYHIGLEVKSNFNFDWTYKDYGCWYTAIQDNENMTQKHIPKDAKFAAIHYCDFRKSFSTRYTASFEHLLEKIKLKNKDIKITIMLLPIHKGYRQAVLENPEWSVLYKKYIDYINDIPQKISNIVLLDFENNPIFQFEELDYSDPVHFSTIGRIKLNEYLVKFFKESAST